jgi:small subunit ribosomal protein S7
MVKKKINLAKKLSNRLLINGKKKISENIILKSFKCLQKESTKETKKVFQLAIINTSPTFKIHKISNKKKKKGQKFREIPAFISTADSRSSLAIKFLLKDSTKKPYKKIFDNLAKEIITAAKLQGNSINSKNELQKQVLDKRHFFKYYRWK